MVLLNLIPRGFYHGWEGQEISFLASPMYSTVESACNKFSSKRKWVQTSLWKSLFASGLIVVSNFLLYATFAFWVVVYRRFNCHSILPGSSFWSSSSNKVIKNLFCVLLTEILLWNNINNKLKYYITELCYVWQLISFCFDLASNWLLNETFAETLIKRQDICFLTQKQITCFLRIKIQKFVSKSWGLTLKDYFNLLVPSISTPSQLLRVVIYSCIILLLYYY